ncbi:MAG: ribose 5-phosphate isomerase B [Caldilineaceae bacterium]|nr:ribose 5-phosphate isomerase B [Caldilineaceae bacterium]
MRIAVASDHVGLSLKPQILDVLSALGVDAIDLGPNSPEQIDFPDFAERVGRAIQNGQADRGILICGSGVGMSIAANKMADIRAAVTHDTYSAHQGVEHDNMNVMCLGSRIIGPALAAELVHAFATANFDGDARFVRRLDKIDALALKARTEP